MEIRFALPTEKDPLMEFIDQHWKKDHILAKHKELFDWQYLDQKRDRYNFIIAVDNNEIGAILGFIPMCQFDPHINIQEIVWLAIWKVTDKAQGQKLGQRLLTYLDETIKPKIIAANAISASAAHRYLQAGYTLGRLNHWFIINQYKELKLPILGEKKNTINHETLYRMEKIRLDEFMRDFDKQKASINEFDWPSPDKTATYFVNRYFKHPIYEYEIYRIHKLRRTKAFVVTRTCTAEDSRALRIIEYIGPSEALLGLKPEWERLLRVNNADYIDFYNIGINNDIMQKSGFLLREHDDGYVIPNYFEPFERKNVEIETMISIKPDKDFRIFKGDSDQDRPNIIP